MTHRRDYTLNNKKRGFNAISRIRRLLFSFTIFLVLSVISLFLLNTLNIIPGAWSIPVSIAFSILGVLFSFLQWLFPVSPYPQPQVSWIKKEIYRSIEESLPPMEPETTLPRREEVQNIYKMLIQKDTTTVALTGVGGIGKTWLAALVCKYSEEQRQVGNGPFNTEMLWLEINRDITIIDLAGTILDAQSKSTAELSSLAPRQQAELLFDALNIVDKTRLIVLDQFEQLLNEQGHVREDRPGIGEWIDLIYTQPRACRVLITSRLRPLGMLAPPPGFLQEIHYKGLTTAEGIELLRKQGIGAAEKELHELVANSGDSPLLLTQVASLVREHSLSLDTLFDSSKTVSGAPSDKHFDVFLCYNSEDRAMAEKIGQQLKEHGILPWIVEWELQPQLSWQSQLEQQIQRIPSAAVLVGKNGVGPWQRQIIETLIQQFVSRRCPVIPVLLEDTPHDLRLPSLLRNMTWVDFRRKEPDPIGNLIWGITGQKKDKMPLPALQVKFGAEDFDVFFCYNEQDRSEVEKIGQRLKSFGILPWLDEFRPGLPWQELLDRQIGQAKSAIVFIGENGIGPWQQQVMEALLIENVMRNCPVITVLLANTSSSLSIPKLLGNKRVIDLRREDLEPMERLIRYITNRPD